MNPQRLMGIMVLAITLGAPLVARAQEMNLTTLDDESVNRVHVRTGAEYGFVAGVGYARVVSVLEQRVLVNGDLTVPWAGLDSSDYRLRVGALIPIVGSRRWRLAGTFPPTVRGTRNDVARMLSLGADAGLTGGYFARRWFAAGELGYDWSGTTHVTNSDLYRTTIYAGARDGWYANAGGNLRAGMQAGVSFMRYDLILRAGALRDFDGQTPLLPFYGTLTLDTRF